MKTVILAGGRGLRYNNSEIPKSLAMIGNKPIIQHVMEIYSNQGYNDFVLCMGYKKEKIIDYFNSIEHNFNIEFIDTGEESNTGERIRLIKDYIPEEDMDLYVTYADGLANINLSELYKQHKKLNSIGTLTAVRPNSPYGVIHIGFDSRVVKFEEKPKMREYVSSGFMCFRKDIFDHITKNNEDLEKDILPRLCYEGKLRAYKHDDWFDTLNSPKDEIRLNQLYDNYKKKKVKLPWVFNRIDFNEYF